MVFFPGYLVVMTMPPLEPGLPMAPGDRQAIRQKIWLTHRVTAHPWVAVLVSALDLMPGPCSIGTLY
jgi:hypothetical protein